MPSEFKVSEAASLLGVSDDTIRRWASDGRLKLGRGKGGVQVVDGRELAALASAFQVETAGDGEFSVRNRMLGIVTSVKVDEVMAQVDVQAGPFRLVSLVSSEAVDQLGIEVGMAVVATAKATNVGIELAP